MIDSCDLIQKTIELREKKGDTPRECAVRLRKRARDEWCDFFPYRPNCLKPLYKLPIDGIKIRFRHTTVFFNARP